MWKTFQLTIGLNNLALHIFFHFRNSFCAGENCHRGSALGALLGASAGSLGKNIPSKWTENLALNKEIDKIIN